MICKSKSMGMIVSMEVYGDLQKSILPLARYPLTLEWGVSWIPECKSKELG